jgi:microsomal epoxide hydrolase
MSPIVPFELRIAEVDLVDLKHRLDATRWPQTFGGETWRYGARIDFLQRFQAYWRNEYDWRAVEARLNSYPQFLALIDGVHIHFFHVRAKSGCGRPLLLLHGWPGSQVEFLDIIDDLSGHGPCSAAEGDYDLVIPAIPGFGFGGKPAEPGWGPDRIATAFHTLMTLLGYHRYGVQGGDWGGILGRRIAQRHSGAVAALHSNMPYAYPPAGTEPPSNYQEFRKTGTAYLSLQATKPDAIAPALSDSPMGLATWILEKFASWGDGGGDIPQTISFEHLISNIMFYWLPNSAASAARIYFESAREETMPFGGPAVTVPTAVAAFAAEPYLAPREWVERLYNVVRWEDFPTGGHFAALEQKTCLLESIRTFFATVNFDNDD